MAPFACGGVACKFSARPLPPSSPYTAADGPDFLRANLALHLAEAEARFEFLAQPRTDPGAMPVEDPRILWDETASPFVPVAEIAIPRQRFATPEGDAFGENLSFTPWHCVDAHRPLGGINRLRRTVYETISRLRHEMNGTPRVEPTASAAPALTRWSSRDGAPAPALLDHRVRRRRCRSRPSAAVAPDAATPHAAGTGSRSPPGRTRP